MFVHVVKFIVCVCERQLQSIHWVTYRVSDRSETVTKGLNHSLHCVEHPHSIGCRLVLRTVLYENTYPVVQAFSV